jgi:hypothetical protein
VTRRFAALVVVAACGAKPTSNTLFGTPTRLAEVGAPHVPIYVTSDRGLVRVFLDTGTSELVNAAIDATAITATTTVRIDNGHYVIERAGAAKRLVVDGVAATPGPKVSPDGRWLAVAEADRDAPVDQIAIISVADGSVRHVPVEPPGPPPRPFLSVRWAGTSDAVLFEYAGRFRLDRATGKIAAIDKEDWLIASSAPTPTDCPARGFKLERRTRNHRQEIVLISLASQDDPERIVAVEPRVLVASSDHPGPSGDGAVNLGKPRPGALGAELLSPSCDHFVFTLEDRVYVGNVATGRFAFLIRGGRPALPRGDF